MQGELRIGVGDIYLKKRQNTTFLLINLYFRKQKMLKQLQLYLVTEDKTYIEVGFLIN